MLDPGIAREITLHLREGLAGRGEIGRFLLDRTDEAVARGIEERQENPEGVKRAGVGKQVVIRRAASDEEVLRIHLRLLRAYVIELPDIAQKAEVELQERFGVESVVLALETDEARELNESRDSVIRIADTVRGAGDVDLRAAIEELEQLVERAANEGVEVDR